MPKMLGARLAVVWACALAAVACGMARAQPDAVTLGASGDPARLLLRGANLCMRGPSAACCGLLNHYLGDADNPLTKCVCLHKVMSSLERAGVSLDATIDSCRDAKRDVSLAAAFLARDAATCPAGAGGRASAAAGPRAAEVDRVRPLLEAAVPAGAPEWGASNIEQGLVGGAAGEGVSSLLRDLCYNALVWVPIAGATVFALILAVHVCTRPFWCLGRRLAALGLEQRLVSAQHVLFATLFGLQLVPYTVMAASFLFQRWTAEYFVGDDRYACALGVLVGLFVMSHALMYCMESGLRVHVKPSPLLLFHHALFFLLLACGLWLGPSMLLIKVTIVLDLGAVHELPLYIALLVYRLSRNVRAIHGSLVVGMVWYGITRLVQTALLLWLLIACDPALRRTAPYIICAVVAAALTGVQAYTFAIYGGMYRRAGQDRSGSGAASAEDASSLGSQAESADSPLKHAHSRVTLTISTPAAKAPGTQAP